VPKKLTGKTNWLITGGCGFIGSRLVRRLIQDNNIVVRILDNFSVGSIDNIKSFNYPIKNESAWSDNVISLWVGDILDIDFLAKAAEGATVLVHLAGNTGVPTSIQQPFVDCRANVIGILNALDISRKGTVEKFIFSSSSAPLGQQNTYISENLPFAPTSPYGASKASGESYCSAYYHSYGLETAVLRFSNVYGPGSQHKQSVVANFISNTLENKPLIIYGDGTQSRDFIFSEDVVDAICMCAKTPESIGETFQLGTGCRTSINTLVKLLTVLFKKHHLSLPSVVYESARRGEITASVSDINKARTQLGWSPKASLLTGLEKTLLDFI
jgi:UDP-glucose 4-epimerase